MHTIDTQSGRSNNFDGLRMLAAVGVVLSHAYPVTQGSNANEIFMRLSGGQTTLGEVCVIVFFVISGFLIAQSFARSGSLTDYLTNRIVRIVPGLVVVTMITAFVVGPLLTSQTSNNYWTQPATYRYLGNILIYPSAQKLPGVFDSNVYQSISNASLWTLCYEFSCYTGLATIGLALKRSWLPAILIDRKSVV